MRPYCFASGASASLSAHTCDSAAITGTRLIATTSGCCALKNGFANARPSATPKNP
jgi:hypothetical protein